MHSLDRSSEIRDTPKCLLMLWLGIENLTLNRKQDHESTKQQLESYQIKPEFSREQPLGYTGSCQGLICILCSCFHPNMHEPMEVNKDSTPDTTGSRTQRLLVNGKCSIIHHCFSVCIWSLPPTPREFLSTEVCSYFYIPSSLSWSCALLTTSVCKNKAECNKEIWFVLNTWTLPGGLKLAFHFIIALPRV